MSEHQKQFFKELYGLIKKYDVEIGKEYDDDFNIMLYVYFLQNDKNFQFPCINDITVKDKLNEQTTK